MSTKPLANRRVLLGVSAGIAAYKTPDLVRKLVEQGAEVQVILSKNAEQFVTPLALQAVSGHPVHHYAMTAESESGMGHIDLARWADIVLIAPATANMMARLTQGMGDELLTTICLATTADVVIAPAMNQQMWQNEATQENLAKLQQRGVSVLGPDSGEQACGEVGPGRMLQPKDIAAQLGGLQITGSLQGVRLLLTAGPTWEAIDPVRGITNHSSGTMGYALASAAVQAGANVTLVSGPCHLEQPDRVNFVSVNSALEMHAAVMQQIDQQDIFIAVAAVADYRPIGCEDQKIKKNKDEMTLTLVKNPDILGDVASRDTKPFCVGFAAETNNVIEYAKKKLDKKKLNLIAANHVGGDEIGFRVPENAVSLISHDGITEYPKQSKYSLARALIAGIAPHYQTHLSSTSNQEK